jgi:DNA polymerase/3'-5' exonuclease PolX
MPDVKDIEIVCIPDTKKYVQFFDAVNEWQPITGDPRGKYTQRFINGLIKLDLFMATLSNFGYMHAIRTGPVNFSKNVMTRLSQKGYTLKNGHVYRDGHVQNIPDELVLFSLMGMDFVEPRNRY